MVEKTGKTPEELFNKTRYGEYFVGPLEHLRIYIRRKKYL